MGNGGNAIQIVVKEVTSTGFKMKMHEPDCYDGVHPVAEHVGWMVAERGLHTVNGVKMLFDKTDVSGSGWNTVNFNGFSSTPSVITSLTDDVTEFAYLRHDGVSSSSFQVNLDSSAQTDVDYPSHEVSYVVIQRSSGFNNNKNFEAGMSTGHNDPFQQITFSQGVSMSDSYAIFAGMTFNGPHAANLRLDYDDKVSTSFHVGIDEAEACDWDGPHPVDEDVYWFVLDTGILEAK